MARSQHLSARNLAAGLGVIVALAVAATLRLRDPLSTRAIAAEDPYTHMALVRQHLRDGALEPLYASGHLYPPGMHAFLASIWSFTGAPLYDIVRFTPVVLGVIGVLGIAILLWRTAGPVAGIVGAMAAAVAPEVIHRTTMMSPTALDLALLPFLLLSLAHLLRGRMAWTGPAVALALLLVFAHPWVFGILALTGASYLAVSLLPRAGEHVPIPSARGAAAAMAIVGSGLALTLTTCGGYCGPGFQNVYPPAAALQPFTPLLIVAALTPLVLVVRRPALAARLEALRMRTRGPAPKIIGPLLLVALAVATVPALTGGFPEHVELPRMLGWPLLLLAAAGVAAFAWLPHPIGTMGVAWVLATYPFVVNNPLQSEFWPHRTAVFLGLGLVLLAGFAAALIARRIAEIATPEPGPRRTGHTARRGAALMAPAALATLALAGGVYGATPEPYPGGWYRLYPDCEFEGLQEVADRAAADPNLVVVTPSWEGQLVITSMVPDAERVFADPEFYTSEDERRQVVAGHAREGNTVLALLDRYAPGGPAMEFGPPLEPADAWCHAGFEEPRLVAYRTGEVAA